MIGVFVMGLFLHLAEAEPSSCWDKELNPYTQSVYKSEDEWLHQRERWDALQPENVSLWSLFWAHQTYKKELSTAQTLKNDKRKHCYIGCRIAQEQSYEVSDYVGWFKESEDLQDCDKKTFFEPLDYQSTADGAKRGASSQDPQRCYEACAVYEAPQTRLNILEF